jgi:hypothetical protein
MFTTECERFCVPKKTRAKTNNNPRPYTETLHRKTVFLNNNYYPKSDRQIYRDPIPKDEKWISRNVEQLTIKYYKKALKNDAKKRCQNGAYKLIKIDVKISLKIVTKIDPKINFF